MSSIITFYSYKGGVGRTMALANIAVLLAQMGLKVLTVDWDLEAPGLDRYFKEYMPLNGNEHLGLIDLLVSASDTDEKVNWRDYIISIDIRGEFSLSMMTSGKRDEGYAGKVLQFEWSNFFEKHNGGDFIENLREDWLNEFDVVLIDSRTGITDSGGICTIQLPDILALVFTGNSQSLDGVIDIANRAQRGRQKLAYDRAPLTILPLPSRFDSRAEFEESQQWLQIFSQRLNHFYDDWLPQKYSSRQVLERTKLPYIAYFSFGEKLPVLEQGVSDPEGLGYTYNVVAKLIHGELKAEILEEVITLGQGNIVGNNNTVNTIVVKLKEISIDDEAIRNINSYLSAIHKMLEINLLSEKDKKTFNSLRVAIQILEIDYINSSLNKIAFQAKGLFDICRKELSDKRGLKLLDDSDLRHIDQYLETLTTLQMDLEEASELADWLDSNSIRMAKKYGREAISLVSRIESEIPPATVKTFCFSVNQFLEQIAHCLRWGRYDILDAPEIPLELDISVYAKAFRLAQKDLPPHISEEAKSQFDEYIDYLVDRLPSYH